MIENPIKVKIVMILDTELYKTNAIGFSSTAIDVNQFTDYTFDLSLVKAHMRKTVKVDGLELPAIWVELENAHDVCFLGDYDLWEEMFNEFNGKKVIKW